jgi:hypothetical protein
MKTQENLEIISDELATIESAFDNLNDSFYQIRKCISDIIKELRNGKRI